MKELGIPHQYACFSCRKSFKRKQYGATHNHFMTGKQQRGQVREVEEYNKNRGYKCPDCGGTTYYMGTDYKEPKKNDIKRWKKAEQHIKSGKVFYRGS